MATAEGRVAKAAVDKGLGSRWQWALDLFSTYNSLDADRQKVFNS
jgi:hypothetical protein